MISDQPTLPPPAPLGRCGAISFTENDPRVLDMHRRIACCDFHGAAALAREVLRERPGDVVATDVLDECHRMLEELYAFAMSARDRVAVRIAGPNSLRGLPLDPVILFVHGFVDGVSTVQHIAEASGLAAPVVFEALFALKCSGVITVR